MTDKDNKGKRAQISNRTFNGASDNKVEKDNYDVSVAGGSLENDTSQKHDANENLQKAIHAMQKIATNEQEVITKITSEYMTVVKFSLANARRVWTAAAAWSSGVHKESVEYADAIGDVAAEQLYTNMESIH